MSEACKAALSGVFGLYDRLFRQELATSAAAAPCGNGCSMLQASNIATHAMSCNFRSSNRWK
uniref:Uncharacterized protein n=1 Tax=Rhizobium rhizogenes TaxID=359 RepID=A0A7S4ZV55_RHIRH|nr:hypothetical protein pC6.5b_454 [Rhizobium rhizogenes]QCL10503.1 hypothetical protein pC6.5c_610 [Rhizobium rhizogenes]